MEPEFNEFLQALRGLTSQSAASVDRVVALAEAGGLQTRAVSLPLSEAVSHSGPTMPMLTSPAQRTDAGWLMLEGMRGRLLDVTRITGRGVASERVAPAELAKRLGVAIDVPLQWISVSAPAPLQGAVSTPEHALRPLQRLPKIFHPERREIFLSLIFALGVGVFSLATPIAVQGLVNTFALGGLLQPLIILSILLFGFLSFSGALRVLQYYVVEIIQRRLFVRVLADLAYRLPRLRREVLDHSHGTELVNRFFDVLTLQKVSATLLLDGVAIVLQTTIGLLVLAFYHPWLLGFDIVLLVAILIIVFVLGRQAEASAIAESKCKYAAAAWLEELARNPLSFKEAGGKDLAATRADQRAWDYITARSRHFRVVLSQTIGSVALQAIAGTALLALGGDLVISGQLTLGQLVAAELIVSTVLASFSKFGKHLESFYDLLAAVDKLGHVIDLPLEEAGGTRESFPHEPARLAVEGLHFSYENGSELFHNFSFELAAGERVGLLGGHGSGKSTLADLLLGLRPFAAGRIRLNGIDIRDLQLESLRRYVVVVRDAEIIDDTIVENVRMGRTTISLAEIRQTLADLGLLEEILRLTDGINTRLSHTGMPLSEGQTRRLMLARAVIGRPALLVVDGLLDELEAEVQSRVADYLFASTAPWTLLLLSFHKHGCIQRCDRILPLAAP